MQEVSQPFADSSPETWEKITQLKHASLFRAGAVCASIWGEASPQIIEKLGGLTYVYLEALNGEKIVVSTHEICDLTLGDFVQVSCNPSQVSVFDKRTGNCL